MNKLSYSNEVRFDCRTQETWPLHPLKLSKQFFLQIFFKYEYEYKKEEIIGNLHESKYGGRHTDQETEIPQAIEAGASLTTMHRACKVKNCGRV